VWQRRRGRYGDLARYVSPKALVGLRLVSDVALDQADSRAVAERLYETLCEREIGYAHESWIAGPARQQVRHPRWLLEDRWGTCLDLAVTYATMLLEAGLRPLLAVSRRHAFVLVSTERRDSADAIALPGCLGAPEEQHEGVLIVDSPSALASAIDAGTAIAIDCTCATTPRASFAEATAAGLAEIQHGLMLVDVGWTQTLTGWQPFPEPVLRPTIRLHVPGSQRVFDEYEAHRELVAELRDLTGTVVLIGPAGQGKSTIARQIALEAPFGAGWFLNASEPEALINSLADAELAELNDPSARLESLDRGAYAHGARQRLTGSDDSWVVVLDNADGDPTKLVPALPSPSAKQLVLITTTNPDWERLPGLRIRHLPPIDDERVARELGGHEMVELVRGRPLLLYAFKRLMQRTGLEAGQLAAAAPGELSRDDEARGPATLWAALRASPDFDDDALLLSRYAAYLPPDHQPAELLLELVSSVHAGSALDLLVDGGLITREPTGILRMHRLFGAAVRADLDRGSPADSDEAVIQLATTAGAFAALDGHGDQTTVTRLGDRLRARDSAAGVDERLGTALHAVAALLELHGHIAGSGDVYLLAERHLEGHPDLLADCLHARARSIYRHESKDEERLHEGLGFSRRASRIGTEQAAGRYLAMQGLIMQKLAAFPGAGETTGELLHAALDVIEQADRARLARTDISEAELARSRFNLAGIRIDIAKVERRRASMHLDTAQQIYAEVRDRRRIIFQRDIHAQIATCIIGLGYVNYYRAMLLVATPVQRSTWLREATNVTVEAVRQYEAQEGLVDLAESAKAARFLAKVALARHALRTRPRNAVQAVASEAIGEFEWAPVPGLPADRRGLVASIAGWVRSPPLAGLVTAFDGEPPRDADLGDLLDWLEAFSTRWDYRSGQERNLVSSKEFSPELQQLVLTAAHALGLIGTRAPSRRRYDHVLVLGGLVRACFARPSHAAKLLRSVDGRDPDIAAASVTALGGYRPLRGDELELASAFDREDLTDEFDAMDAGVRAAFDLGELVEERGEPSQVVGAAWRVRRYQTSAGLPIHVIAAPSTEPGKRRANTADTYAWFAEQHAQLHRGQRILVVTTDIYVPYQHADALRMLSVPYGVEIDAIGILPGDLDARLAQAFAPHNYLQEIRSTIRALRALHAAASVAT
jgi:hypothetical protein